MARTGQFWPVVDGRNLVDHPEALLAGGASSDVPLVVGCTRNESALFLCVESHVESMNEQQMLQRLARLLSDGGRSIADTYLRTHPGMSAADTLELILTDYSTRIPAIRLAEQKLAGGRAPVFMYLCTKGNPEFGSPPKAPHGWETPYFFDNLDVAPAADIGAGRDLAVNASEALLSFARVGDPSHPGLPSWPSYSVEQRATMLLDDECRVELDPGGTERRAWSAYDCGLIP
jgi:para-nitrobenzyl esterase